MKEKRYNLETIKQIKEVVTSKNIKMFLVDFEAWLRFVTDLKEKGKGMIQTDNCFTWIDDNKNDITITIKSLDNLEREKNGKIGKN